MHENSVLLFERHARAYFKPGLRVLEVGPDASPSTYRRRIGPADLDWQTADLAASIGPANELRWSEGVSDLNYVMADEYTIPVSEGSFDVVFSGQVIEHVRRVWTWMQELARVCRPGGHIVTIGPVSWPYHEAPIDCWRIFPEGMSALSQEAGLEVVLSVAESLERTSARRTYPGATYDFGAPPSGARRLLDRASGLVGWPLPIAIDTITIARKPSS